MIEYGTNVIIPEDHTIVVENMIKALKKQGYGVITEINVKDKLKKKIKISRKVKKIDCGF
ncbi:MAG: hypothetical protein ACXAB2_02245 [Candidatus Hodarchaeales archaeon]|jgi:uncharacterized protein (DUF302 family)